jgi:hypothetical protein
MTKKIWRGDAPEVAQVTRITPVNVQTGDQFSILINGKPITVTAATASAAAVCTLLASAIAASPSPEFAEFDAVVDGGSLVLTASTAGVPFVVTAGAGNGTVVIDRIQAGYAGANSIQAFKVGLTSTGGFTVVFGDQKTASLAIGTSAAALESALEGLSTIGSGNCSVSAVDDANDRTYTVEFLGALATTVCATLIVKNVITTPIVRTTRGGLTTVTPQNEIQSIQFEDNQLFNVDAGGSVGPSFVTYKLTLNGQDTVEMNVRTTAAGVKSALVALAGVDNCNVGLVDSTLFVEFLSEDGSANQSQLVATMVNGTLGVAGVGVSCAISHVQVGVAAKNETQTVTPVGSPTGGTYTLTFGGNTTSSIAYNASAGAVETALEALASIGSGNATVTGDAGGPWTVEFTGTLAAAAQSLITATSSLTGGVTDSVTIVTTTASGGPNHYDDDRNWSPAGVPVDGDDVVFAGGGADCLYGLDQSSVLLDSLTIEMSWQNRKLGLPEYSSSRYLEYRPQRLKIGATEIIIGSGVGTGPSRVYFDTGTDETLLKVFNSGSSSDTLPAVVWVGLHVDNAIEVYGGEFGTSPSAPSTFRSLKQTGGRVVLHNATVSDAITANGNSFRSYNTFVGGALLEI